MTRPDDASAYHSSGLPVSVSRDDAVRLAADLMHDPAAVALRAAARDKFLAVLDWTDDAGRSRTSGWEIDGIKYVTAAGAARMGVTL